MVKKQDPQKNRDRFKDLYKKFESYLVQLGLRQTRQRKLIFEAVVKMGRHVDAEAISNQAKKIDPTIGLATVYRTLQLMTASGILVERRFGGERACFEFADSDEGHHDHLICLQCGEIIEFFDENLEALQESISKDLGFALKSHKLELFAECQKAPKCDYFKKKNA